MFETNDLLRKRVYAFTTDLFIVVVVNYFLMASFTNFLKNVFFYFPLHTQMFLVNQFALMSSVSLMTLSFGYFSIFCFVTNGRTMGKAIFDLKAVSADGEITLKQSLQRAFAYFACALFGSILFALSFIRKDHKSLADVLSGTSVTFDHQEENSAPQTGTEFQLLLFETIATKDQVESEYFEDKKSA